MKLAIALLLALPLFGTITNSGSASITCLNQTTPGPSQTFAASGASINLLCPDGWSGAYVVVAADPSGVTVQVGIGPFDPAFSFVSSTQTLFTPTGGTGPGTAEFTVTFTWSSFGDNGRGLMNGQVLMDGQPIWSRSQPTCLFGQECWSGFYHYPVVETYTLDEPVTYGTTFSLEQDTSAAPDGGDGYSLFESLAVSGVMLTGGVLVDPPGLVEVPEPAAWVLLAIGIVLLLILNCEAILAWIDRKVKDDPPVTDGEGKYIG